MAAMARLTNDVNPPESQASTPIKVLFWHDVFVVSDNGRAGKEHYTTLGDLVLERTRRYPGVGMLSIIPEHAVPPSDEARRAMNQALARVEGSLRAICWL